MATLTAPQKTPEKSAPSVLLSCHALTKRYLMGGQELQVLKGVDISVDQGQWLAVLGSSGSGKSTLLHLLGGLDRPDSGEVLFKGQSVFNQPDRAVNRYRNRMVGFVFQFYHLLPELSALENVLVSGMIDRGPLTWLRERASVRKDALELLDRLGLSHRLKHRPAKLSGGERQRVAIARALINRPALLLADEPTGNLDTTTGQAILKVFDEFHKAGQTIIMVTHDTKVASLADKRVVLEAGKLA
jgi:lipoprotein-releasing system ATP-binding protein